MKNLIFVVFSFMVFLTSCQKEMSLETGGTNTGGGGGGNTSGTLLIKAVAKAGTDSTVSVYDYNSSNKLIRNTVFSVSGGQEFEIETAIKRNSQGIIEEVTYKSDEFIPVLGLDEFTTKINYNSGTKRYTSKITIIAPYGFDMIDSVAINYDGNGKVISEMEYIDDGITGYELVSKTEYTYSGNNLTLIKSTSYDAGVVDEIETSTFEYDSKINPVQFSSEAVVLGMEEFYSANNITKMTYDSSIDPLLAESTSITYTYKSNNRPGSAVSTYNPGGIIFQNSFTYK